MPASRILRNALPVPRAALVCLLAATGAVAQEGSQERALQQVRRLERVRQTRLIEELRVPTGADVASIAFSGDGDHIALVSRGRLHAIDRASGATISSADTGMVCSAFSGPRVIVADLEAIRWLDCRDLRPISELPAPELPADPFPMGPSRVAALALSPDGGRLLYAVSGERSGQFAIDRESETARVLVDGTSPGGIVTHAAAFLRDGQIAAAGQDYRMCGNAVVCGWLTLRTGRGALVQKLPTERGAGIDVDVNHDATLLAWCSGSSVRLLRTRDRAEIAQVDHTQDGFRFVDPVLALSWEGDAVTLWNTSLPQVTVRNGPGLAPVQTVRVGPIDALALDRKRTRVAVAGGGELRVYRFESSTDHRGGAGR